VRPEGLSHFNISKDPTGNRNRDLPSSAPPLHRQTIKYTTLVILVTESHEKVLWQAGTFEISKLQEIYTGRFGFPRLTSVKFFLARNSGIKGGKHRAPFINLCT
jgi:hypothetical protein